MKRAGMLLTALAATSAAAEEVTVTAVPLPSFQNAAIGQRVQGLVYRGGLQLSSVPSNGQLLDPIAARSCCTVSRACCTSASG